MIKLESNPLQEIPKGIDIPDLTTATLTKYYGRIDTDWTVGTQLATLDGKPYARTYSVLSFPPTETTVNKVDLDHYSEDYEGDFYYRVSSYFIESLYNSSISMTGNKAEDFLRWRLTKNRIRQEEIYAHQLIKTLEWKRPSQPTNPGDPDEDPHYLPITNPFTIPLIKTGKAIKAKVSVVPSDAIEIRLKSSPSDPGTLVTGSSFYLTEEYLEIKLINVRNPIATLPPAVGGGATVLTGNGASASHHKVTIEFYGKFKWRSFAPAGVLDERNLIHPVNASRKVRLKPPGRNNQLLPDKFWNSHPDNIVLTNFGSKSREPGFS